MDDLSKKLDQAIMETIWINRIDQRVKERVHPYWFDANGDTFTFGVDVELIKQILKDACRSGNNYPVEDQGHLLTGREWYERFWAVMRAMGYSKLTEATEKAAKKASGIEQ